MRRTTLSVLGIGALIAVAAFFFRDPNAFRLTEKTLRIGDTQITLELARTDAEKTLGLGNRASLSGSVGMLFLNSADDYHAIWMKDMRFSIDILWLAYDGQVVDIKENASPDSYPQIFVPRTPARFVLEMNAGFARTHHVNIGDSVTLPPDIY